MSLLKSVLRIVVLTLVGIEVIGCFCINSLMFHPVRKYDAGHPGYVDIGRDGERIAAIVCGQQKGRKALLYCHGNAEDATGSMEYLKLAVGDIYTIVAVDYPGYGLSEGNPDDSIIPFAQGKELFGLAPEPRRFIAVKGADHNDLIDVLGLDEYRKLLKKMCQ